MVVQSNLQSSILPVIPLAGVRLDIHNHGAVAGRRPEQGPTCFVFEFVQCNDVDEFLRGQSVVSVHLAAGRCGEFRLIRGAQSFSGDVPDDLSMCSPFTMDIVGAGLSDDLSAAGSFTMGVVLAAASDDSRLCGSSFTMAVFVAEMSDDSSACG